jgi:hypothetical protein
MQIAHLYTETEAMLESGVEDKHNSVCTSVLLREIICYKLSSIVHGKHSYYPMNTTKAGTKNSGKENNFYENLIYAKKVAFSRHYPVCSQ